MKKTFLLRKVEIFIMSKGKEPEFLNLEISKLVPYIEKVQVRGGLSLVDAYVVKCALDFLNGSDTTTFSEKLTFADSQGQPISPANAAEQVVVSTLVKGQEKGAFSLTEASELAVLLKMIK